MESHDCGLREGSQAKFWRLVATMQWDHWNVDYGLWVLRQIFEHMLWEDWRSKSSMGCACIPKNQSIVWLIEMMYQVTQAPCHACCSRIRLVVFAPIEHSLCQTSLQAPCLVSRQSVREDLCWEDLFGAVGYPSKIHQVLWKLLQPGHSPLLVKHWWVFPEKYCWKFSCSL